MTDRYDKLIGHTIDGRFRLDRLLGEGGMGKVYYGIQVSVDRPVAVKLLRSDLSDSPSLQQRFFREAKLLASLHHPNIVGLVDFGRDDEIGALYMAMQFVDGKSLADLMKSGRLPLGVALSISRQICSGLAEAHAAGIVHRDLKPENVMLQTTAEGAVVAKILDFGIALPTQEENRLTSTGGLMGTPYYMSPEQAQDHQVGASSDLYAIGVMLYEMMTGTVPFKADTPVGVLYKTVNERHTPVKDLLEAPVVRGGLTELVDSLLAKDPSERPSSAAEVARRLDELQNGVDVPQVSSVETLDTLAMPAIVPGSRVSDTGGDWSNNHTKPPKKKGNWGLKFIGLMFGLFLLAGGAIAFLFVAGLFFAASKADEPVAQAPNPPVTKTAPAASKPPSSDKQKPMKIDIKLDKQPDWGMKTSKTKKSTKKKVKPKAGLKRRSKGGACQRRDCAVLLTKENTHYVCQHADCEVDCEAGGCSQVCQADSTCKFHCAGGGCRQTCFGGTTCTVSCAGGDCNRTAFSDADMVELD